MAAEVSSTDRLDALFEELVPFQGKCDTVAGEIVRATCRVGYRWYNDGDCIGVGYGKETCNPAARYLCEKVGGKVETYINEKMWGRDYEESVVDGLVDLVMDYLDTHPELKETPNTEDMFDYFDKYEDIDDCFEDEYEDGDPLDDDWGW